MTKVPTSLLTSATIGSYRSHDPTIMTPDAAVLWDMLVDVHKGYQIYPNWNLITAQEPTELVRRWLVMDSLRPVGEIHLPSVHIVCWDWAHDPSFENLRNVQATETAWGTDSALIKLITHRTPMIQYEWLNLTGSNPDTEQHMEVRFRARLFWWLDLCDLLPEPV